MRRAIASVVALAAVLGLAVPVYGKIRASRDTRPLTDTFMKPRDIKKPAFDSDFIVLPPEGSPAAYSDRRVAKFPRKGNRFAILSSGNARAALKKDTTGSRSADNKGPLFRGVRDLVMMRVRFKVPKNRNCLSFTFKFLSEEFPEYVGSSFNDAFIAELDETIWDSPRDDPSLGSVPNNFARDSQGNLISVNAVGAAKVKRKFAKGTTYDAATRTLKARTPVTPGRHSLFFSIFDQGDRQFDSTVFIDRVRITRNTNNCTTGVVRDR